MLADNWVSWKCVCIDVVQTTEAKLVQQADEHDQRHHTQNPSSIAIQGL